MASLKKIIGAAVAKKKARAAKAARCQQLARKREQAKKELERVDKQLEAVKAKDKEAHTTIEAKLKERQAKERDKLDARQKAERDKLDARFSCVVKPRAPRKPGAAKPPKPPKAAKPPKVPKPPKAAKGKRAAKRAPKPEKVASDDASTQPRAKAAPRAAKTPRAAKSPPATAELLNLPPTAPPSNTLSVSVEIQALSRAIKTVTKAHRPTGLYDEAWDLATLYVVAGDAGTARLAIHARINRGEIVVSIPIVDYHDAGLVRVQVKDLKTLVLTGDGNVRITFEHSNLFFRDGVGQQAVSVSAAVPPRSGRGLTTQSADIPPEVLRRSLEAVLYALNKDTARPNLLGLSLELAPRGGTVFVTSDGHRLVAHEETAVPWVGDGFETLVIEGAEVHHLMPLLKRAKAVHIALTPRGDVRSLSIAGFDKEMSWMLVLPELWNGEDGQRTVFPEYKQVIPRDFTDVCEVPAAELRAALKPLTGSKHPTVTAVHDAGKLVFTRTDVDGKGRTTSVASKCKPGRAITFGMNPEYFLEAIDNGPIADADVAIFYERQADSLNPIKLTAAGPGWTTSAVIMPQRM